MRFMGEKKTVYHAFLTLKTTQEIQKFLEDLLSPHELSELHDRWEIVKALLEGKTQRKIRDELGVSISKITRGSTTIKYGKGAFKTAFNRLGK